MAHEWQQQVVDAKQGDMAAFDRVIKQFEDMAIGYAFSLLGDFQLAEDAAQEAFVEAYFCLAGLREPGSFPAWFRKIVFKQCDRIRRRKQLTTVPLDSTTEMQHPGLTPLEAVMQRETEESVLSVINALPEMERTVTSLAYINGYSLAEVGDFLEVPVSTVKNRLHTARKQLKERMVGIVEDTIKSHAPGDDFSRKVRSVLQGSRVGFFNGQGSPENLMFPGVMRAIAEYIGNDCGMPGRDDPTWNWPWKAYAVMAVVTGSAFRYAWNITEMPVLLDIAYLGSRYLDMFRDAFDVLGLTGEFLLTQEYADRFAEGSFVADAKTMRNRIKESIAVRRMPVVVMGMFGPPEPCIVTGYDDGGDVLIGWDHYQRAVALHPSAAGKLKVKVQQDTRVSFEPSGCFRLRDWARDACGVYVITGTKSVPALSEMVLAALERGALTLRMQDASGFAVGTASLQEWGEAVERADELDDAMLAEFYTRHNVAIWDLAERRSLCDCYLRDAAAPIISPEAQADLNAAADLMEGIHNMMYEVADLTKRRDNVFDGEPQKIRDQEIRRKVIKRIMEVRLMDERAANHLARVLAIIRGDPASD